MPRLDWKKFFLAALGGGLAGTLGHYSSEVYAGHHVAFTAGNILGPAVVSAAATIAALFTDSTKKE